MKRLVVRFLRWAYKDSLTHLVANDLDYTVAEWAHRAVAEHIWRQHRPLFYIVTCWLIPTAILSYIFQDRLPSQILAVSTFFVLLSIVACLLTIATRNHSEPRPEAALHDIIRATDALFDISELNGICKPDGEGWGWRDKTDLDCYSGQRQAVANVRSFFPEIAWSLSRKVAGVAGHPRRETTNERWSYTSRVLLWLAEEPFNRQARWAATAACVRHIEHYYYGRLFDPVPRDKSDHLPRLKRPRVQSWIRMTLRTPTTYTVVATLLAAVIAVLPKLLPH